MTDGSTAFLEFKRLVTTLREWGFDVRDDGEFGEFSLAGFVCSYRFFGVLDVNFLKPGELLGDQVEPDMVLVWNGRGWEELTEETGRVPCLTNSELYRTCVRTINFMAASRVGISPGYCVVPQSA